MMKKTLLVGLDAACWAYYQPLLNAGELPVLARLVESGARGDLISTMPAWTPAAWASLVSGKNPGKHGVFDMMWLRPGSYEFSPTNARKRLGSAFWKHLNAAGLRVGLINVPFSHPPDPLDGFVLTGFGAPGGVADVAYPPELVERIEARFGKYEPWLRFEEFKPGGSHARVQEDAEHQSQQVSIGLDLLADWPVDVLVINLMLPDHANHWLPDEAGVAEAIRQTDRELGRLLQAFSPDNTMLISDHGARRVKGDFLLHVWLRDQGYSVQRGRSRPERSAVLNQILLEQLGDRMGSPFAEKLLRRLVRELFPYLPGALTERFWASTEAHMPFARDYYRLSGELDYARTQVFLGSSRSGLLYLNLAGKYPQGCVPPEQKQALLDELVAMLRGLQDPDGGGPLFNAVHLAEDIYHGPALQFAPDITIDHYASPWNLLAAFRRGAVREKIHKRYFVENTGEFGHHSRDGLYVFSGQDFRPCQGRDYDLVDVSATLLHLYDIPIPDDFDGKPMLETLCQPLRSRPVRSQPGDALQEIALDRLYSEDEEGELVARMQALGYLD